MTAESEILEDGHDTEREENLASFIAERWSYLDNQRNKAKNFWQEIEAFKYATDTNNDFLSSGEFEHTTHIPVVAPIAQDLEAIMTQVIFPHKDWFNFSPQDKASAPIDKIRKVVAFLKNRHKIQKLSKTTRKLISDFITYGTCFAQVDFIDETKGELSKGYIGPKVSRISPYDIVFDPTAESFTETPKIVRQLVSLGKLYTWGEQGVLEKNKVTKIIDERRQGSRNNTLTQEDKNQQYVPQGFNSYESYMSSGVVEILWFYGDIFIPEKKIMEYSRRIGVVGHDTVIYNEEIDTISGKPDIFQASFQERPDNLWPMGALDNIIGLNYQINHRENGKNDALDKLINPDKVLLGNVEEIYDDETGTSTYLATEGGGVQELAINTQFFQFDLQIQELEKTARLAARLPLDLIGFRSPGEKTLGEVSALNDGAMRGFLHKARNFEEFMEEILTAELEVSSERLSALVQVPGQIKDGVIPFLEIAKSDLSITGQLNAQGSLRFSRKNQLLSQLTQLQQAGILDKLSLHISTDKLQELINSLIEYEDTGIFEKFSAIAEQAEAQEYTQEIERALQSKVQQQSVPEGVLDKELNSGEALPEGEGGLNG